MNVNSLFSLFILTVIFSIGISQSFVYASSDNDSTNTFYMCPDIVIRDPTYLGYTLCMHPIKCDSFDVKVIIDESSPTAYDMDIHFEHEPTYCNSLFTSGYYLLPDTYHIEVIDIDFDYVVTSQTLTNIDNLSIPLYKDISYQVNIVTTYITADGNNPNNINYQFNDIGYYDLVPVTDDSSSGHSSTINDEYGNVLNPQLEVIFETSDIIFSPFNP